jgi:hypothetical protein
MMSLFKKVSFFLFPLLGLFLFLEIKLSQIPTYLSLKKEFLESQLGEIEVLSTGHSYGNAINPSYIDHKAFNLFNDTEDFYYDVRVIEKYMDRMPNLKMVLVPISYFSLDYREEQGPWAWRAPFYKFIFDIPSSEPLSFLNPSYYSHTFAYGWREVQRFITTGFSNNMTNKMHQDGWREVGSQGITDDNESNRAGKQSIEYIESILKDPKDTQYNISLLASFIEKCQAKNIKIILFTPPAFHNYYDYINPNKYQQMQEQITQLVTQYHLEYFDFLRDGRFVAADFHSIDHVNDLGAEKFSRIMNELIKTALAEPSV